MVYQFHATLFAAPEHAPSGQAIDLGGRRYRTLAIASNELVRPFRVTFEQVERELVTFPRMICEPDGSFVWSGEVDGSRWQVDGLMFDRDGSMLSLQLKGNCPAESFDQLLDTLGWPDTPLVFQLAWEGVLLNEEQFRRWATREVL